MWRMRSGWGSDPMPTSPSCKAGVGPSTGRGPAIPYSANSANILYGYGFSGNGIVGCRLGGEILRSLALEKDDAWSRCGLVRPVAPWMPVEPFRFAGAHLVRAAIRQQDRFDHQDRDQGPVARALADLVPGRIVTTKAAD